MTQEWIKRTQSGNKSLLLDIINDALDVKELARMELHNRGLNEDHCVKEEITNMYIDGMILHMMSRDTIKS